MPENSYEIKDRLQQLIDESPALKTLSEEERAERIDAMMGANEEQMKQLIKIFEDEKKLMQDIDEDFEAHEQEINEFLTESKKEKKAFDKKERINKEKTERTDELKLAENLLKKLDEIV